MKADLTNVREGYDRWAAVYDHVANPLQALEGPAVRAACGPVVGLDVLDLGCGTGRHTLWLVESGATVSAVDFSAGMLAEAKGKVGEGRATWVVHDLHEPFPFPAAAFDLVVSGLVLEHIREVDTFVDESRRVLRPGGRAVLTTMHPAMFLRGTMARFTDPASGELVQPGSMSHSVSAYVMAAIRAGFTIESCDELVPDEAFAKRFPRAEKYLGWPMLLRLVLLVGR